jgi:Holliday junction resolvasome RuvABC DNA-binding subunit
MIDYLYGKVISKHLKPTTSIILDVNGIGYVILITLYDFRTLNALDQLIKIYVVEVSNIIGHNLTNYIYGFLTLDARNMYFLIRNEVPGVGSKKAMLYINKIAKDILDFQYAISTENHLQLENNFAFTKTAAKKLISSLKHKMQLYNNIEQHANNKVICEAIEGLISLGYTKNQSIIAVNKVCDKEKMNIADLIKKSLIYLK